MYGAGDPWANERMHSMAQCLTSGGNRYRKYFLSGRDLLFNAHFKDTIAATTSCRINPNERVAPSPVSSNTRPDPWGAARACVCCFGRTHDRI